MTRFEMVINVMKLSSSFKKIIGNSIVSEYYTTLGYMLTDLIDTSANILDDKAVLKLVKDLQATLDNNREALVVIQSEFQKFAIRQEENGKPISEKITRIANEIKEVWNC